MGKAIGNEPQVCFRDARLGDEEEEKEAGILLYGHTGKPESLDLSCRVRQYQKEIRLSGSKGP